ncbi:RIP homotypic interaction motif-containing protein [Amycolatopsis sp. lyj-109]|uniref:RIP homotypic interaction motif-containing protein n=1 Tax=Amycolatopsis sp. lyj-109 TaxID=2789287 RepID=UPI00397A7B1B
MDPSAIIAAALAGGAAAEAADTATAAVVDAYRSLRSALQKRLPNEYRQLFDEIEADPDKADILIHQVLRAERVQVDDELYRRARDLLGNLSDSDAGPGKYNVVVHDSKGVQIGDHNMQMNTFSIGEDWHR